MVGDGQIWGEASIWGQKSKYAQSIPLVHVETDRSGRHEPLASTWGARFSRVSKEESFLVVWRDAGGGQRFTCGNPEELGWYPLEQTQIVAFDADGTPLALPVDGPGSAFPAATGIYKIGEGELGLPYRSGWIYLNLNYGGDVRSSWVDTQHCLGSGRRRGRTQALMFTSACDN